MFEVFLTRADVLGMLDDLTMTRVQISTLITARVKEQWEYRERQIKEHEQVLNRRYGELEKAVAQTTIAIVEVMESMQFARKQWEAIKEEQNKQTE